MSSHSSQRRIWADEYGVLHQNDGSLTRPLDFPAHVSDGAIHGRTRNCRPTHVYIMPNTNPFFAEPLLSAAIALSTGIYVYKILFAVPEYYSRRNCNPQRFLEENFVFSRTNLQAGRWWTLFTHTFDHASLTHLAYNMHGLWSYGNLLIPLIGPINTAIIYTGSAVVGALLTLKLQKNGFAAGRRFGFRYSGASSSVLGLMTTYTAFFPHRPVVLWPGLLMPAWMETLGFAAYSCWAQYNDISNHLGHLGHLGGMIFGAAFYYLLPGTGWPIM